MPPWTRRFLVARNPEPDSALPYLLFVPVGAGLVLKARDTWPWTSRVYCHRVDTGWPDDAEIVEDVAVIECQRRGIAVDLLLDRKRENRSHFVFPGRRISDLAQRMTIRLSP